MDKKINEIPFGAKDSELYKFEYTIPEGYEAEIKDGKVIIKKKESEDEKIRMWLIRLISTAGFREINNDPCPGRGKVLDWLERQKEQKPESCDCSRDEESYTNGIHHVLMNPEAYGLIKQKPAEWRDTDMNEARNNLISVCRDWERGEHTTLLPVAAVHARYFLEHLTEPKPAEWSDDFEENIRTLLHNKLTWHSEDGSMSSTVFIDDKTLKDIVSGIWFYVGKEALKYPNKEIHVQGWSDEDRTTIERIVETIQDYAMETGQIDEVTCGTKEPLITYIRFLRSLRPQPHWKPSEEQMEALKDAFRKDGGNEYRKVINSLYRDLEKLL